MYIFVSFVKGEDLYQHTSKSVKINRIKKYKEKQIDKQLVFSVKFLDRCERCF